MKDVELHHAILKEFGHDLDADSLILDFGCGHGELVQEYRCSGLQAFGVDLKLEQDNECLRLISTDPSYRIPFPDNTFDFVFSNSVLEHVQDLDSALSEIYRVLKPGGASLHLFPPRARPIEPHVFVPLGGMLRSRPWLLLWAFLGVRNSFQKRLSYLAVARGNHTYLHSRTFYRSRRELQRQICRQFGNVVFADRQMIKHSYGNARRLSPYAEWFPICASLYGSFHNRCVFFEKGPDQAPLFDSTVPVP
jgi:ubiquinone/menaquinone biosynthesis C-methylase UbiE